MQHLSAGQGSKEIGPDGSADRDRAILNYIRKSLRATWPWTRLLSVLGFIGTGLMILAGLGLMVGESFIPVSEKAPPLVFMGILYVLISVFYLVPSIWLSRFSSATSAFLKSGDAIELGKAIAYQKSFWKFIGILALVSIVLTVVGVIAAILIPTLISVRG
ncbi:MAG: hypothetical protein KJP06_04700 [Deltaproteobacteria bacterium]|nr:hypothetical protein [Deltaproteobacteria bacterium]